MDDSMEQCLNVRDHKSGAKPGGNKKESLNFFKTDKRRQCYN